MEYRIKKLRKQLKASRIDALLVSNPANIFYLTGFVGLSPTEREVWLLVTPKKIYFFTDGRYINQVQNLKLKTKNFTIKEIAVEKNITQHLADITTHNKINRIGFEAEDLRYAEFSRLTAKITLVPTNNIVLSLRSIKDKSEITFITHACKLATACLTTIIPTIKIGVTEKEIASRIESYVKTHGLELSFYPIVAVDKNGALPHYDTKNDGSNKVKKGSVILIDFGIQYKNYQSDISRMVFVGHPKPEVANVYRWLLEAQEKAIEALKKTADPKKIDVAARSCLDKNNLPNFAHSTGHGVGIEIHELPKISFQSQDILQKGNIFTIEPGVYISDKFGMRIEDTVWLKNDKQPVLLTKFTKKIVII